jgi:hypothetical protein
VSVCLCACLLYVSIANFLFYISAVDFCINLDFISAIIISGLVNLLATILVTEI